MEELIKTLEHEKQLSLSNIVHYRREGSVDAALISQGEALAFDVAIEHLRNFFGYK